MKTFVIIILLALAAFKGPKLWKATWNRPIEVRAETVLTSRQIDFDRGLREGKVMLLLPRRCPKEDLPDFERSYAHIAKAIRAVADRYRVVFYDLDLSEPIKFTSYETIPGSISQCSHMFCLVRPNPRAYKALSMDLFQGQQLEATLTDFVR